MNSKTESITPMLDVFKWVLVVALFIAGIIANSYYAATPAVIRLVVWIVLAGVMAALALQTKLGKQFWTFSTDSRNELRKVVWPTRQETFQTTLIVMLLVLVVAAFLWLIDTGLLWLIGWLSGQRG